MSSLSSISTIRNLAFSLLAAGTLCAGGSLITATQAEAVALVVGKTATHPVDGKTRVINETRRRLRPPPTR